MKKLVLAAALAASLSTPVIAADVNPLPWPWTTTAKVTSVAKGPILSKMVVVGGLAYQNPEYTIPNGAVVNPTLTLTPTSAVTLNGVVIGKVLTNLVDANCVIEGSSPNLNSRNITSDQFYALLKTVAHTVIKATCTK